jgi:hypothetical protein
MQQTQNNALRPFIAAAKLKGISDEFLTTMLVQQGWPKTEVFRTLGAYWEQATGMAIPERTGSAESSRDAFLYLPRSPLWLRGLVRLGQWCSGSLSTGFLIR